MSAEDLSIWARIAAGAATLLAAAAGLWRHTHKRIDGAYARLELKADQAEVNRQRDNIAELFRQQREDRAAIMAELRNTNELLGEIHVGVTRELGDRPTREEVERMIEKGAAAT